MASSKDARRYRVNFGDGGVTPQSFPTQSAAARWMATAKQAGGDPYAHRYFIEYFDSIAGWLPVEKTARATKKKTARQLDSEIAAALATGPAVTISVHENTDDETDDETYTISDDGGEFDDVEEEQWTDVQGDIDERRHHYASLGRRVVLDAPERLDLR